MYCGPASLRYFHMKNGKLISMERATKYCSTTKRYGTSPQKLIEGLEKLKYKSEYKERLSWGELQKYFKESEGVFILWWSEFEWDVPTLQDGHWSVVEKVEWDRISLWDPDAEEVIILPRKYFELRWYDCIGYGQRRKDYLRSIVIVKGEE